MSEPFDLETWDNDVSFHNIKTYPPTGGVVSEVTNYTDFVSKHEYGVNPVKSSRVKPADLTLKSSQTGYGAFSRVKLSHQREVVEILYPPNEANTRQNHSWTYTYRMPHLPSGGEWESFTTQHLLRLRDLSDDFSQDLAEFERSASGFSSIAKQAVNIWKRVKGKSRKKISVCDLASANLAVQYGIKPLVNAAFSIKDAIDRRPDVYKKKVVTSHRQTLDTVLADDETWRRRLESRYISLIQVNNLTPHSAVHYGNPAEWVWERIPYSFIIDQLVNVGDTIAASSPLTQGLKHLWTLLITKDTGTLSSLPPLGSARIVSRASGSYEGYHRQVFGNLPSPPMPTLQVSKSMRAVANNVSLLVSHNKKCGMKRTPTQMRGDGLITFGL